MKSSLSRALVYLALVFLVWAGITLLPGPKQEVISSSNAYIDLHDLDFDDTVFALDSPWKSWPEELYTPHELATAETPQSSNNLDYTNTAYATFSLTLKLQPGTSYGISFTSSKYAMRLFVEGEEAFSTGTLGPTRENTEPREYSGSYYFTPSQDTTEIIVHAANFVHRIGCQPPDLTIGTQQNITQLERQSSLQDGLIIGCLIASFLFHLGIFLLNRQQKASLLFALFCMLLAIQSSQSILFLIPQYDWSFVTRIEYLVTLGALTTLILLIKMLFPQAMTIWVYRIFISVCLAYCVLVLFTDSTVYTQGLPLFQGLSILLALYILIRLAMTLQEKNLKNSLAFLGLFLVGVCGIGDVLLRNDLIPFSLVGQQVFSIGTGAMLLVFCYVLVLALEQAEVNKRAKDAQLARAQAEERYAKLMEEKHNGETLTDRLANLGLTKRETEVATLLLNGNSREEVAGLLFVSLGTINTHCTNIYRKVGCGSIGELAQCVNPNWFSQ